MRTDLRVVFAGLLVCFMSATTFGGVLNGDGAALVSGSLDVIGDSQWAADVDYAVYAPGDYPGIYSGADSKFIYAYQIFNESSSTATLASFSVGLLEDAFVVSCGDDATYGAAGGVSPLLSRLVGSPATSAQWTIDVDAAENTTVLVASSPFGYTFGSAALANGGESATMSVPTPSADLGIPEPATLSLLVLGGLALIRRRRRA